MAFNIDGLVSGLDTAAIIDGLVALQQTQVDRLTAKKTEIQVKQEAFQGVEARLFSLRSKMGQLNRSTAGAFSTNQVSSSDESLITATANSKAAEGSYNVRVMSRAQAHQIGSTGFSSTSQTISQGTISFQTGSRPATEITIDGSNNTVSGLVDAINKQAPDISAAIIHDQASGTDRILLTSKSAGTANAITINNNLAVASGDIARPDFSGIDVQSASNATVQLGSGPGAITAEFSTNKVDGLIEGVTLDLKAVDINQDVVVSVSRDTEQAATAINEFVDEFNSLMTYINEQTKYDSEAGAASPLLGNRSIVSLKNQLSAMVTDVVPGVSSGLNRFSQLGISIDGKGQLSVNSARLNSVLSGEVEGINRSDIPRLFGLTGSSSQAGVEFLLGSYKTATPKQPIQIDITQAAERARVTASNDLASSIVIDNTNSEFQISIDGLKSDPLTLTAGTYTQTQLVTHLQSLINSSTKLGQHDVLASLDGNKLKISSLAYGSNSKISEISGSAITALGLLGTESGVGVDVAGSFIVNGKTEVATGNGRVLIGDAENENTADMQVLVTLAPTQVGAGIENEMTLSRGVTSRLDQYLGDFLDQDRGALSTINEGFDLRIESIDQSIDRVNKISAAKRDYLVEQFATLERVLSELQSTSSVVSSQLAGLN